MTSIVPSIVPALSTVSALSEKELLTVPLAEIALPNNWVLYLYNKQTYKKLANNKNCNDIPHRDVYKVETLNDVIHILQLMEVKIPMGAANNELGNKINLDCHDYIIMRKGIPPVWEDAKNKDGGAFTLKVAHRKGYKLWSTFAMHMLGETLMSDAEDMAYINGLTVSFIPGPNEESCHTYLKLWDGRPDRAENAKEDFMSVLPSTLLKEIEDESIMYSFHNKKKDFNQQHILSSLNRPRNSFRQGGFKSSNRQYDKSSSSSSSYSRHDNYDNGGNGSNSSNTSNTYSEKPTKPDKYDKYVDDDGFQQVSRKKGGKNKY